MEKIQKICSYEGVCCSDRNLCETCTRNYANKYKSDNLQWYIPACKYGFEDCVLDPAYMKRWHSQWYEKNYGDMSPEDVIKLGDCCCNDCSNGDCYDDEDK